MELTFKRIDNLLKDYKAAQEALSEVLTYRKDDLIRDATVTRFTFTFELAWKLMKALNKFMGSECYSPKECIRLAAQNGLLSNPGDWFKYHEHRNVTTHTYDLEKAEQLYRNAPAFERAAEHFLKKATEKTKQLKEVSEIKT